MANTSVWAKPDPDLAALRAQMASPEPAPTVWAPMDDSAPRALPAQPAPHVIWAPPHTAQDDAMNAQPVNMPDTGANLHAGLEKVFPPAQPQVALDPNPQHQIEGHLTNRLQQEYAKDAPWNPDDHGTMGKIGHVFSRIGGGLADTFLPGVVPGTSTYRHDTENNIAHELNSTIGEESQQALQGAQAGHANAETRELEEGKVPLEQAKAGQAAGANDTKSDIATQHNQTLEDIASMHQAAQRAFQHVVGTSGGKDTFANYDPSKGVFTDLAGNILTDFKPKDKAMQGAYGAYGPMRLAGQLLNYASNDNPALIPVLSPIISHMMASAGGGNAAQIQDVLGKIPEAQPQDDQGQAIGLRMPGAPTGATRSRGQFAEAVLPSIADAEAKINQLGDKLGPMSGRFSELYTGKLGAYGPEYSGLQTTLHNIGTAWMRLHANSESARQDFLHALSSAKDPANLIANLHSIDSQARDYVQQGKGRGGQGSAQSGGNAGVPKGATHTVPGSDGKMHYTDGKNDLGVVK